MLTGNELIDFLYLPESSEEITKMREKFNIPKPELGKKFKKDGYVSTMCDDVKAEIFFSDVCKLNNPPEGRIFFSRISYQFKTTLQLPMSLKMGMSYDDILEALGRREDFNNKFVEQKVWLFNRKDGKEYVIYCLFSDGYKEMDMLHLATYENVSKRLEKSRVKKD